MAAHRAVNSRGRVSMQVWGEAALFTRPEFKTERVTYPCMTPTAAVGVLESIYWHPGMRYEVDRIEVLKPIVQFAIRRNETSVVPSARGALAGKTLDTSDTRTQRMSLCLRDAAYRIHAWIQVLDGADKPLPAYRDQFFRRLRRGACFSQPYLGSREFVADFGATDDAPVQQDLDLDMGLMPHSAEYERKKEGRLLRWRWFGAELKRGVLRVPPQGLVLSSAASALEAAG